MRPEYAPVRYELLRPMQIAAIRERCPIAYMPTGSIEWHSFQNPLGTDAIKAHAVCCEAALLSGGVVVPPIFQGLLGDGNWGPAGWENFTLGGNAAETLENLYAGQARALARAGWQVIVGVCGHDPDSQRDLLHNGIRKGIAGTAAKGFGITEGENWEGGASLPYHMDHAGAWETSCMMYAVPESVRLDDLRPHLDAATENLEMRGPQGIGGRNPLVHASAELGERIVKFCARRIADKAARVLRGEVAPLEIAHKSFMDNPGPTD